MNARIAAAVLAFLLSIAALHASAAGVSVHTAIEPQRFALETVAGGEPVDALLRPGQSPHSYEPTPSQVTAIVDSDVYFASGLRFEDAFLRKLKELSPTTAIVPLPDGLLPEDAEDMHWWLDPRMMVEFVRSAAAALSRLDPEGAAGYAARADSLGLVLNALDEELREELKPYSGGRFYVFHPAFGHFASAYGLEQRSIEAGGHEPGPRELAELARRAKAEGARTVFVQPQFPSRSASVIADELGGSVVLIDPLAYDYIDNMRSIAASIRRSLETNRVPTRADGRSDTDSPHEHGDH